MRFWLSLAAVQELGQIIDLARHAETCGYHGVTCSDHLIISAKIQSRYPYRSDGKAAWHSDYPWPDPWIVLSIIGSHTQTIMLASNVYLAALRHPVISARIVGGAASTFEGRVIFGVGAGWMAEEYDALGIEFESRGDRLDESLAVARKLWSGQPTHHKGRYYRFDEVVLAGAPAVPPPIWVGGASHPALRRAAFNDGWFGPPVTLDANLSLVDRIRHLRREADLNSDEFRTCLALKSPIDLRTIELLNQKGIGDLVVIPWIRAPWEPESYTPPGADLVNLGVRKDALSRFAERFIDR